MSVRRTALARWQSAKSPRDRTTSRAFARATTRNFYSSTVAVPANGKIAEAVAFGVKTQTRLATTGLTTAFGTSVFGAYGGVGWLVGADTLAELDTLQHFMTTDAEFGTMVAEAGLVAM